MIEFVDKTALQDGTPLNRANLMAIQGLEAKTIVFEDGCIVETNDNNETLRTTFNGNVITETFTGEKTIIKTTTFNEDGSIREDVRL